jgi:hypothetical protein
MDRTEARRKWGEAYGAWYWAKRWKKPQAEIVAHILDYRRYRAIWQAAPNEVNERGNTIYRDQDADRRLGANTSGEILGIPDSRYFYDFGVLQSWQQFDTKQDASYFGVWVNIAERKTFTYCEGDRTLVECPDDDHLKAELDDMVRFYGAPPPAFIAFEQDKTTGKWTRTDYIGTRPTVEDKHE